MDERRDLPPTWTEGGPSDSNESRAAALVRDAVARADVEPDAAVGKRVRRGVLERMARRRRHGAVWFGVGSLAGAALVAAVVLWTPKTAPAPAAVSEGVVVLSTAGVGVGTNPGDVIQPETPVRCATARCRLVIGRRARAELARDASLRVVDSEHAEVLSGAARFSVDPLSSGEIFSVHAEAVRVDVLGTEFAVELDDAGTVRVRVSEGRVEVHYRGESTEVAAGDEWSPTDTMLEAVPNVERIPAERTPTDKLRENRARTVARDPSDSQFERVEQMILRGEILAAEHAYLQLSGTPGPTGERALLALSKLHLRHTKKARAAITALEEMERRYPWGNLEIERRLLLIEVALKSGRCHRAKMESIAFERDFPDQIDLLGDTDVYRGYCW